MKKIIVCGDSFMSPVVGDYAGTHFSEIVAKEINYELVAYSRGGMSNGGICIQVKSAIEAKPDLILVGTTYFDRLEWPCNETRPIEKLSIHDILYNNKVSLSSSYDWLNKDPKIISTALADIWSPLTGTWENESVPYGTKLLKERKQALDLYFEFLYHPDIKKFIDETMIYAMYHQLHESGIPYIICIEQLTHVVQKCRWLNYGTDCSNYAATDLLTTMAAKSFSKSHVDPGYHTTVETQRQLSDILLKKYIPNVIK